MASSDTWEGPYMSKAFDASYTVTEDGIAQTDSFSMTVDFNFLYAPKSIVIIELDKDSNVISRKEYVPGEVPRTITTDDKTDYLIVESLKQNLEGREMVTRELYQSKDNTLYSFYSSNDGLCIKQYSELIWK